MNILEVGLTDKLTEYLGIRLISSGYNVFSCNNDKCALGIIEKHNINLIILDGETENYDLLNFLEEVKDKYSEKSIKTIIISENTNEAFIKKLMQYGVVGFMAKYLGYDEKLKKINTIIDKIKPLYPKTGLTKVTPSSEEELSVNFLIEGTGKPITGKIVNLSFAAIVFKLNDTDQNSLLFTGQKLTSVQIIIQKKKSLVNAIVGFKQDNLIGLKFDDMREAFKVFLAQYILSKLTE